MTTILHLTESLVVGGCTRVMENLAKLADRSLYAPVLAGLRGDAGFVEHLCGRGLRAGIVGEDISGMRALLDGAQRFVTVVHRPGEETPLWKRALPALKDADACVMVERNIFGYPDTGPGEKTLDFIFCNSMHTLWRHWVMSGRPDLEDYLKRHGVLYNALAPECPLERLAGLRKRARADLGIPKDAFVIGDVCRPAPEKLDYMLAAVLSRLKREISNLCVVTQRFPDLVARHAATVVGKSYMNLPLSSSRDQVMGTYGMMDVLVHMSTMGESYGMAIAEAMRCGLPVVANECPGSKQNNAQIELIGHRETGFLANDPTSVVKRLAELAASPDLRRRMGDAARARFRAPPLSPESVIEQLESEIIRIARTKGWDIPGASGPVERRPSDEEMKDYLLSYKSRRTVPPVERSLRESIWSAGVNARRFLWRVRRKLL